jgi:hypothetical protein
MAIDDEGGGAVVVERRQPQNRGHRGIVPPGFGRLSLARQGARDVALRFRIS